MNPIYEKREIFVVGYSVEEVLTRLAGQLRASGYRPRRRKTTIVVETGSNALLRMFGTMLWISRRSVPAGMTLRAYAAGAASIVEVHAYDKVGWFVAADTNPVLRERSEENIRSLIGQAQAVLEHQD
ncbi:hypothetical protein [uncultured Arthrobacter sp.]|uniref:hypothetical protein n=1 Tax=uncultured Arthrobacter sp. TaxID=114050 RepID=UPI0025F6DED2|nr:hypothetical protein [uncultured Arthrobacter sp.]